MPGVSGVPASAWEGITLPASAAAVEVTFTMDRDQPRIQVKGARSFEMFNRVYELCLRLMGLAHPSTSEGGRRLERATRAVPVRIGMDDSEAASSWLLRGESSPRASEPREPRGPRPAIFTRLAPSVPILVASVGAAVLGAPQPAGTVEQRPRGERMVS